MKKHMEMQSKARAAPLVEMSRNRTKGSKKPPNCASSQGQRLPPWEKAPLVGELAFVRYKQMTEGLTDTRFFCKLLRPVCALGTSPVGEALAGDLRIASTIEPKDGCRGRRLRRPEFHSYKYRNENLSAREKRLPRRGSRQNPPIFDSTKPSVYPFARMGSHIYDGI